MLARALWQGREGVMVSGPHFIEGRRYSRQSQQFASGHVQPFAHDAYQLLYLVFGEMAALNTFNKPDLAILLVVLDDLKNL